MSENAADLAALIALLSLPEMGPARLRSILARYEPAEAWQTLSRGRLALGELDLRGDGVRLAQRWRSAAQTADPEAGLRHHHDVGVSVLRLGDPEYPTLLADDLEPPELLFVAGDVGAIDMPSVAIIGTRRCTSYGARTARVFGQGLAEAGVSVVSGLALGIDAAAHLGVLAAPDGAAPVAVVGTGLDVVYPSRNRQLWADVRRRGAIVSESPLGTRANAWRFPARNRIIAALSQVVVVVESRASGGSMHTVREAATRDRDVLAVPGPISSRESTGTNALLFDGWGPARSVDDVLGLIGLVSPPAPGGEQLTLDGVDDGQAARSGDDTMDAPTGTNAQVLDAVGSELCRLDDISARTGMDLGSAAIAVQGLVASGWLVPIGARFERCR